VEALPTLENDGLETPTVGEWAAQKYQHVRTYAQLFARATKKKWKHRVFLDLFAGAGRARLRDTYRIVPSSSLLALGIADSFDRYIFCEAENKNLDALRVRVGRDYPMADVRFVPGDVNGNVGEILGALPPYGPGAGVLTLCFVDPFSLGNLKFATIRDLADRFMDFLVLVPSGHDAQRNQDRYVEGVSEKLNGFLGSTSWLEEWRKAGPTTKFADFVTNQFGCRMAALGYKYDGLGQAVLVRSSEKNLHLYDLVLFSRSDLGKKFWKETQRLLDKQRDLFD